jgi:plastocyanin
MKYFAFCLLFVASVATDSFGEETGTLKARFVYAGRPFQPAQINGRGAGAAVPIIQERLLVHPEDNGIRNVVMHVYTGRGGSKLPNVVHEPRDVSLVCQNFRFEPRVVQLQVGDTLKVTNQDPVGYNLNLNFFRNAAQNLPIAPGANRVVLINQPEPGTITIECNIRPWMRAYAVVLDHPFVDVSDEHGNIEITGLPTGERLAFRLYHEAADSSLKEVTIGGMQVPLKRNTLEIGITPGMNDLGTITIAADALTP